MKSMMRRTTFREIKNSLGRYLAILAIVALGVGFFSGIKVTKEAMVTTLQEDLVNKNFFDYRILSSSLLDDELVNKFDSLEDVAIAEGSIQTDVIVKDTSDEVVLTAHSITSSLNKVELVDGRMPENSNECIVDANQGIYRIGDTITISENNDALSKFLFEHDEYTVVGIAHSPLYLNFERGSTKLLNGKLSGFFYIPKEGFAIDGYSEIYLCLTENYDLYSDAYEDYLDETENAITSTAPENSYVLTRNTNIGYVCFENDVNIVNSIAAVFPLFFFMVAALVCITTMNRMVEEQRTQIGTLKALGYSNSSIIGKYIFYSGSAAIIGAVFGFMAGTYIFPVVIWEVYRIMYSFNNVVVYVFNTSLAIISLIVALLCSIGATILSCYHELSSVAAELMRPKAPKSGKRILLERIPFIWKRLKFLYKVSIRNVLRYKKRFFMMILGISGCTALLVAGFGIKDSISNLVPKQYGEIQVYDVTATFALPITDMLEETLDTELSYIASEYALIHEESVTLKKDDAIKTLNLMVYKDWEEASNFTRLHTLEGEPVDCKEPGTAVITHKTADKLNISVGDTITLTDGDYNDLTVEISGIAENYIGNYVFMSAETYETSFEKDIEYKSCHINLTDKDSFDESTAKISSIPFVLSASNNQTFISRFDSMISSLDYIVILVIICAAALAFIVLYNLTNINITERIREIATIKVLGFYQNETSAYVFRENIVLTAFGALVGLILGKFLHAFIMYNIDLETIAFEVYVSAVSYVVSFLLTFVFAMIINQFMKIKLKNINMAESLKSIE